MRKANQEIKDKETIESLLNKATICRLAMVDNGLPYLLPFNYGYKDQHIYIHCAAEGRKIDVLRKNPTVCFEIEGETNLVTGDKACDWSTSYQSIVGYGKVEIVTDFKQKQKGLEIIMAQHGAPNLVDFKKGNVDAVVILKLKIDSLSGKQSSNWDRIHDSNNLNIETERR